ncbi:MAG TPA: branched-chain amino acid ABC transporter permease [Candidatus Cybelea sp.]|nr:branched-chain amino acid ABC transporter permease [Candidatus Cybelea sp.]
MDGQLLAQLIVNGVMVGCDYALWAIGLTVIFGILEQVNFSHGELYMLAAFLVQVLVAKAGLGYEASFIVVLPVMAGAGLLLAKCALLPTLNRPFEAAILATLAVGIILQNAARMIFGASPLRIPTRYEFVTFDVFGLLVFGQRLFIVAIGLAALSLLLAFLRLTRIGAALRAAAQNKDACLMVGIDIRPLTCWTAGLAAMLCGVAGGAVAPLYDLYPSMGTDVVFKSFAVVIMGGMGNVLGAVLAALILGLFESLAGGLGSSVLRDGTSFAAMLLVLLVRPNGLFGRTVRL